MKISLNMLKQYLKRDLTEKELYELTNEYITEVESVETLLNVNDLVVGYVKECIRHPNADKLSVCQVDLGDITEQIVCGAPNVKAGQYVVVAKVGAVLPGNFEIKSAEIRGVKSNGMICSLDELGYGDKFVLPLYADGIYAFEDEVKVGENANTALGLNQISLELDVTPNRADLLSVLGFAYDLGAVLDEKIIYPEPKVTEEGPINPLKVTILGDGCNRYYARYLDNIKIKPSPLWLQANLIASGIRPINNVVDITNYVLMELGTPLHAFDADKFGSNEIVIKNATDSLEVLTLDEQTRVLKNGDIIITNGDAPVALGGVMGLYNSMIDEDTTKVILEAASFDSKRVKNTSRRLDLISDSSLRFERGIDEVRVRTAINRAAELLILYADARVYKGVSLSGELFKKPAIIQITPEEVNKTLGTSLDKYDVKELLRRLNIIETQENNYLVPTYRNDLKIGADLTEEIARLYGYNNIPITMPVSNIAGSYSSKQVFTNQIRKRFKYLGFNEVINYSLGELKDIDLYKDISPKPLKLLYPLKDDRAYLRHSLVNGLVSNVGYHLSRQHSDLAFFEVGNIYYENDEPLHLAAIINGNYLNGSFTKQTLKGSFYLLKGLLEDLFKEYNISVKYVKEANVKGFHPGSTARILLNNETLGFIGKIHPAILDNSYAFEVNLEIIFEEMKNQEKFSLISKYPSISRDIAVLVNKDLEADKIRDLIVQTTKANLTNLEVFDVYFDEKMGEDKVSLGFRLTFNSTEKTLESEDVDKMMKSVIFRLERELKAEIRQ